jgi:SAM-dependent methyltransferase
MGIFYSFPFEACREAKISSIYIFGAGLIGCELREQVEKMGGGGITILGFVDNYLTADTVSSDAIREIGVQCPEILKTAEYDGVVLACNYKLVPELCECLYKFGVDSRKVLTAKLIGRPSINSVNPNRGGEWNQYYDSAEKKANIEFKQYIEPMLGKHYISFEKTLDFPSGRGRIAAELYKAYGKEIGGIVCCDVNAEAIDYCRQRFDGNDKFDFIVNEVDELHCLPIGISYDSFSFIYSWDAMVHFSYKWLDFYINEFYRLLFDGGHVFLHHSNLSSSEVDIGRIKSENWHENDGGRSLVCADDIKFMAERCGFEVLEQTCIDWVIPNLDCITILKKP